MRTKLSPHFFIDEMLPSGMTEDDVPLVFHTNLEMLANGILEPLRAAMGAAIHIHSGYRPLAKNASVGGKPASDHLTGNAADLHVDGGSDRTWQEATIAAYHWIRSGDELQGQFGQVILEDHRKHYGNPAKLWIHVSNPTARHPGTAMDINRVLLSWSPKDFEGYTEARAPLA